MTDQPREPRKASTADTVLTVVMIAAEVVLLDQLTGRHLATAAGQLAQWAAAPHRRADTVIPANDITALHAEARRITQEATRGRTPS